MSHFAKTYVRPMKDGKGEVHRAWLIFTRRGIERMTKTEPALAQGEYAMQVYVELPSAFFARPVPRVEISLPTDVTMEPSLKTTLGSSVMAAPPQEAP